jgi:hypothetical protein
MTPDQRFAELARAAPRAVRDNPTRSHRHDLARCQSAVARGDECPETLKKPANPRENLAGAREIRRRPPGATGPRLEVEDARREASAARIMSFC